MENQEDKGWVVSKPWFACDIIFHRKSSSEGRNIIHLWRGKHHTTANSDAEGKPSDPSNTQDDNHKTIATSYYIVRIIYYIMRTLSPITGKAGGFCHGSHCYKPLLPGNLSWSWSPVQQTALEVLVLCNEPSLTIFLPIWNLQDLDPGKLCVLPPKSMYFRLSSLN